MAASPEELMRLTVAGIAPCGRSARPERWTSSERDHECGDRAPHDGLGHGRGGRPLRGDGWERHRQRLRGAAGTAAASTAAGDRYPELLRLGRHLPDDAGDWAHKGRKA